MKILQMNLIAFGPFKDTLLELGDGNEGLHIIYGPNEAGKSSALRALRQTLFGIPERSLDDFVHPYAKLRIGAVIEQNDGARLEFIRRKGRANTLRGPDDSTVLDDALLRPFLGGMTADLFSTMFGIDHGDLVRGGTEIIQGGGNLGQMLFAAGSGIADLRKVQEELQAEADALFRPSGQKPLINEALSKFKKTRKDLRDAQLPGQEWERHDEALSNAKHQRADLVLELTEKQKKRHRLERIRDAFPLIGRRKELLEERTSYADAVLLPEDFGERRASLLTDLRIGEDKKNKALTSQKEIREAIAQLDVSEEILEKADLIEQVYKDLGSYQKAKKDRIQLETRKNVLWSEAKEILAGLRDDFQLEDTDKLRLKRPETVKIRELGTRYERLVTLLETTRDDISKFFRQVNDIDQELATLESPLEIDDLQNAVENAAKYAALEDHSLSEEAEIKSALDSLQIALQKQTLWTGTFENLEKLPLPSIETIDSFDHRLNEAEKTQSRIQSDRKALEDALLKTEGQIKELRLEQAVPTEEDLQNARIKREEGWKLVRQLLDEETGSGKGQEDFINLFKPAQTLADAYELSVKEADHLSDRLRREANRVTQLARLLSDKETGDIQRKDLEKQLEQAENELNAINKEWFKVWEPAGIVPRSPREMHAWILDQQGIIKDLREIRVRRAKADDLKGRTETHRNEVDRCLTAIFQTSAKSGETLSDLILRSRQIIKKQEKLRAKLAKLVADKNEREKALKEAGRRREQIEKDITHWQGEWEKAIRPLGLDGEATPGQANAVMDDLKSLFDKLKEADILHKRIKGIDTDAEAFSQRVTALVDQVAIEAKKIPIEQAAADLNGRLTRAREAGTELKGLEKQLGQEEKQLREAEKGISGARSKLDRMCEEAHCSKYEDLSEAEKRSFRRRRIEAELEGLEEQLRKLAAGMTVEEFVEDAQRVDPDEVHSQIDRLNEEVTSLEKEKSDIDRTIGGEEKELEKMDGSGKAADLAEDVEMILGGMAANIEQYARLRLASAVLSRAIERYREKNEGPVLKRTNELFAAMTMGSFAGVRAEFDEHGNPTLVGVRPGDKGTVSVEGMSDGTADQLYLALRLASLEKYMENSEPLPFIVDDILIRFDDERSVAALQVLAQLATSTQVIFFTHHRHLVDLATANVDSSVLFEHVLQA
ncbi:MAG: AAA family ATPase [Desulfatiglandaceae bacterium]